MKRKLVAFLAILLCTGCAAKNRTEVIDILLENGFVSGESASSFEKVVDGETVRVAYISNPTGYTDSLYDKFGEGPIIGFTDNEGNTYNYQINEKVVYYSYACEVTVESKDEESESKVETQKTEVLLDTYSDFVIGTNACNLVIEDSQESKDVFKAKKEQAVAIMKELGLSKKDLNKLKFISKF